VGINELAMAALDDAIHENTQAGILEMRNTTGKLHNEWVEVVGFCDKQGCKEHNG
jgi:hypothetical protein